MRSPTTVLYIWTPSAIWTARLQLGKTIQIVFVSRYIVTCLPVTLKWSVKGLGGYGCSLWIKLVSWNEKRSVPVFAPSPQQRNWKASWNEWASARVHPPCGVQLLSEMRSFTSLSSTISFQNYKHSTNPVYLLRVNKSNTGSIFTARVISYIHLVLTLAKSRDVFSLQSMPNTAEKLPNAETHQKKIFLIFSCHALNRI